MTSGVLCSGSPSCQAPAVSALPSDTKLSAGRGLSAQSFWNSLQTFSFERWCSGLLADVLATSTPFAAFLKTTLHTSRSSTVAPEKALFPLPFPKLGLFASRSSRQSSRARRKLAFDQAFHILIAALNFLHADCSFPPLDLLFRIPSSAQWHALWNLRNIFKAFGNSGTEFMVPKSGRRSTNLVAGLCDLSEFLTRSGASGDAYFHGFAGEKAFGDSGSTLEPDLTRAEELVPYRTLDASRIRLSGEANWDPLPYLNDEFLMPFLEPNVLLGRTDFDYDNVPNLDLEDSQEVLKLAKLWDTKNLLTLRVDLVPPEMKHSCLRCFNCFKDSGQDRLIGDRRGRNQLETSIPGPSRYLPTGSALTTLEVPLGSTVAICATDLKDYYHQLKVSPSRSRSNALWPPIPLSLLQSTRAYDILVDSIRKKKHWTREERGDHLAALSLGLPHQKPTLSSLKSTSLVHGCFNSVAQGDHLGVEFATDSHRNLLKSRGLLVPTEELVSNRPFAGLRSLQGLIIDDFFSISIERPDFAPGTSLAKHRFDLAAKTYAAEGLQGSPHKDVIEQQRAKIAGAELDATDATRRCGVVSLGAPAAKRLALALVSQEVAKLRCTTDSLHSCLLGGWTSALMYRRPLMSVLFESHRLVDSSILDSSNPKVISLPRPIAQELLLLSILCPLMCSDLTAEFENEVFCTDSSDAKGAIVATKVPTEAARYFWRVGSKKGGYSRLLTKEEALLHKLSVVEESEILPPADSEEDFGSPKKSPLLRYDFIELCGGAAKVSRELSKLGWVVGPCLDLDSSSHYDLSALELLRWVLHLLESGRLDGFLVQPPCTTFSPAQHPASRSYVLTRGYDPTEPRTLLGTTLALRSFALMLIAARINAIGLLEQSRRSKMCWMPEWRRFLDQGWAHEEWCASCMYGSKHRKEFRFLATNLETAELHRKCDNSHQHIKIEGQYTKASAVYTDELAYALAACISKGLRRKKACEAYSWTKDSGLEAVAFNDLLVSSEWAVVDDWTWKAPAHINIHETASVLRLLKRQAVRSPKKRLAVGVDSHVGLSALAKGRSPSYGLRPVLRRACCCCLAGCLYPAYLFAPTRWNPADCPTRNLEFPRPVPFSIYRSCSFESLLALAPASGLRRFLSNWARLALLLLGGKLSSWKWEDSGRFSHYSKTTYPYGWSCCQGYTGLQFDKTLGFPGEGPFWIWFIFVFSSLSFDFGLSLSSVPPCHFCLCSAIRSERFRSVCVAAMAPPSGYGKLEPRDRGDLRRASERAALLLTDGRPVQPRTKDNRDSLIQKFDTWLQTAGESVRTLIDSADPDIDKVNRLLELYGRELFRAGRPYNHYAETLNAVSSRRPRLRRSLQQAWNLAFAWLREEPGSHHVALPWQCLVALVTTSWFWGWQSVAGILALSWGGVTRIGEATSAYRKNLLLPSDFGWTIQYVLLQIVEPKTRFKAARHQVARVDQPQLVAVIELAFKNFANTDPLWPYSGQTL